MNDAFTTLRITASDPELARVAVRRQQFVVGRPIEFDQTSSRVAALEYALGALGAEVVNGLRVFAARRRIEIDAVEAVVTADLENPLAYLEVVGETGRPVLQQVHLKVFVSCADQQPVRELFYAMLDRLPLTGTLRTAIQLTTELIMTA